MLSVRQDTERGKSDFRLILGPQSYMRPGAQTTGRHSGSFQGMREPNKPEVPDAARWAFINHWEIASQADDRKPMRGGVDAGNGSAAAQRSSVRRAHQIRFKEWSKERSDEE